MICKVAYSRSVKIYRILVVCYVSGFKQKFGLKLVIFLAMLPWFLYSRYFNGTYLPWITRAACTAIRQCVTVAWIGIVLFFLVFGKKNSTFQLLRQNQFKLETFLPSRWMGTFTFLLRLTLFPMCLQTNYFLISCFLVFKVNRYKSLKQTFYFLTIAKTT